MKKTGQQTRFRDDLRRLLLFYSLLPVLSAVLLLIVFLGIFRSRMWSTARRTTCSSPGHLWPGMAKPAK